MYARKRTETLFRWKIQSTNLKLESEGKFYAFFFLSPKTFGLVCAGKWTPNSVTERPYIEWFGFQI